MASNLKPELRLVLDMMCQPAFVCNSTEVIYCNGAASKMMVAVGDRFDRILGMQFSLINAVMQQEQAQITIYLCGRTYPASIAKMEGLFLFLIGDPIVRETLQPDTLTLVAAQLRTQLNGIMDEACGLFRELAEQENARINRSISRINQRLLQMLRLDTNLRDISQIMQDRECLNLEQVEVQEFLQGLADEVGTLFRECGVQFQFTSTTGAFYGMLDTQKVERIVLNLLSNALKFTAGGGTVAMNAERKGGVLLVRIADSGEGIPPEVDAFYSYQRREFFGDPRRGVGFGIPIATHYARLHGGSVMQESRKGGGTVFVLSIRTDMNKPDTLASPLYTDYASGFSHALLELSDVLPPELYLSSDDI